MIAKIKDYGLSFIGIAVMIALIAFVDEKSKIQRCLGLEINLSHVDAPLYIDDQHIENYITRNGKEPLIGKMIADIDLGKLEQRVKDLKQVEFCEVYGDLHGKIHVKVVPFIPYARIISNSAKKNRYLNSDGVFFPLSDHHSARVFLLSGSYFNSKKDLKSAEDAALLELIHAIKKDDFWNAQITQMEVDGMGEIKFLPMLGKHHIEFGDPEDYMIKLKKLKVFYKQIMSVSGWENFTIVKLQYANQIVCE